MEAIGVLIAIWWVALFSTTIGGEPDRKEVNLMRRVMFVVAVFVVSLAVSALLFGGGYLWRGDAKIPACEDTDFASLRGLSPSKDPAYVADDQHIAVVVLLEDGHAYAVYAEQTDADWRFAIRLSGDPICILRNTSQGG